VSTRQPKVSLVVVATGLYIEFVAALVAGAKNHVLGLERIFILSDAAPHPDEMVTWLPWGHMPWPYPALLCYRAMTAYRDILGSAEVLLYMDVDMRFQRNIQLPPLEGTFAVQHPGFVEARPGKLPYERRAESTSCIPRGEGTSYFAGAVQGGHGKAYLTACATIAGWIQADLENGVVPLWHDESAWNRYCLMHPPELVLPHSYCSPEYSEQADAFIVALDKDHDRLRESPLATRLARRCRRARSTTIRVARRALKRVGRPA
jgi:histo-blood group ABO system transferase